MKLPVLLFAAFCLATSSVYAQNCQADFSFGETGLTIDFTDESTTAAGDPITDWLWNFGDGTTSTEQNPTHTFPDPDDYDVCLSITTANGCTDTHCVEIEICVLQLSVTVGDCDANDEVPITITVSDPYDAANEINISVDGDLLPGSPFDIDDDAPVTVNTTVPGDGLTHTVTAQSEDVGTCSATETFQAPDCTSNCFLSSMSVDIASGTTHNVDVGDDFFAPQSTTIEIGDVVHFQWVGDGHSTTSDATTGPDSWNSGVIGFGSTYDVNITNPGVHGYYCIPHGGPGGTGMSGTIVANCPPSGQFSVIISFTTTVADPAGYNILVDGVVQPGSPFPYNGTGPQSQNIQMAGDGQNHLIEVQDVADPSCVVSRDFLAPDCGAAPSCSLTLSAQQNGGCNASNQVPVDVSVQAINPGSSGFDLFVDGTLDPNSPYSYDPSGTTTVTTNVIGDGQSHTIEATDVADPSCSGTTTITTQDCSVQCAITNLAASTGGSTVHTVFVEDFVFNPASITISSGDIVEWEWTGAVDHTTTSDAATGPDSWDSGLLGTGSTYQSPQLSAGVHGYYCIPHGGPGGQGMAGSITVQADCTNGLVQVTVAFNEQGGGFNGFEVLVDGNSQGTYPYDASGNNSVAVQVAGDGQPHTIVVQDVDDPNCSASTTVTTPDCNASTCSLSVSAQEAGGCSNGTVPAEVTVTDAGGGAAGFELTVDGSVEGTYAYSGNGTTTVTVNVAGDGQAHTITATDIDDPTCTASTNITTTDCSIPCSITNLAASTGSSTVHTVFVEDFVFNPAAITITAGDIVEWEWTGAVGHTTTSDAASGPDSWDSGLLGTGSTYQSPQLSAGVHGYYCIPHGGPGGQGMAGTITVQADCTNGMVQATVTFDAQGGGAAGYEVLVDGTGQGTFPYAASGSNSATVQVPGDGQQHTVTVQDAADPNCAAATTLTTPDCNAPTCSLDVSAQEAGGCSNGTVPAEVTVTDAGGGAAGFELTVDGSVEGTYAYSGNGTTVVTVDVAGDGQAHNITVTDIDDPTCTASTDITTTDCSIPCSITNLAASTGSSTVHTVFVEDFVFNPAAITITAGDIVEWEWTGAVGHTTTSDATSGPDSWDSGLLGTGSTYQSPQLSAGVHGYYCIPHGGPGGQGMAGTITVQADCTNGMVQATVTFDAQGGGAAGYEVLVDGTGQGTFPYAASGSNSATVQVPGDGQQHTVTVQDAADPNCAAATTLTTPDCNAPTCSLDVSAQEAGGCSNGTVPAEVTVTDAGGGAAGFELTVDGSVEGTYAYSGNGTTVVTVDVAGDGQAHSITVTDIDDPTCTASTDITTTDCSIPCSITNLAASTGSSTVHTVFVEDFVFNPAAITITAGDIVEWEWTGAVGHTTTSDATSGPDSWDSGLLGTGSTYQSPQLSAGVHGYYCIPHGGPGGQGMAGTITVQADCTNGMVQATVTFDAQGGGPAGYEVLVDGTGQGTFPYAASGSNSATVQVPGDGQQHTVTVQDAADPNCAAATTLTTPDCNAPTCSLDVSAQEAGGCSNGTVPAEVTVTDAGGGAAGFELTVDGSVEGTYAYSGNGTTVVTVDVAGDGQAHNITVTDIDDPTCTASTDITTTDCSAPCQLSNLTVSTAGEPTVHVVEVRDFDFFPKDISVSPGDTVRFEWTGAIAHTTTSDATTGPSSWDSGLLDQGATYDVVLEEIGTHPYYCIPHGAPGGIGMAGSIEVVPDCDEGGNTAISLSFTSQGGGSAYHVFIDDTLHQDSPFDYAPDGENELLLTVEGDGETHDLRVEDIAQSDCAAATTFDAPFCKADESCGLMLSATEAGPCDSDNNVAVGLTIVRSGNTGESFEVLVDGNTYPGSPFDYTANQDTTLLNIFIAGNGQDRMIVVADTDSTACSDTVMVNTPLCGAPCEVLGLEVSAGGNAKHTVEVADFEFIPAQLEVSVGDTVEFVWTGTILHTTTSDATTGPNSWDSGYLGQGATYQVVITEAGQHPYYCIPHGGPGGIGMAGTITAVEPCNEGEALATVSFSTTNGSNTGYQVFLDGALIAGPIAYDDPEGFNSTSVLVPGDSMQHIITVQDLETSFCAASTTFITPLCEQLCEIQGLQATTGPDLVHIVDVEDFDFVPQVLDVRTGETIRFLWTGSIPHTTTSDATSGPDSWDSGLLGQGASYELTIQEEGAHPYYCIPHGGPGGIGMAGLITADPACDNDSVRVAVRFSLTSGSNNGYNLFVDGILMPGSPFPYDDPTGMNQRFLQLPGDGAQHFITVQDTEVGFCAATTSVTVPDCSASCAIEDLSASLPSPQRHEVAVEDFEFVPQQLDVLVGDTIAFVWNGVIPHTATSDATSGPDSWDSGLLGQGAVYEIVIQEAGEHPYYCIPHGGPGGVGMAGNITASDACQGEDVMVDFTFQAQGSATTLEWWLDGVFQGDVLAADGSFEALLPGDGASHEVILRDGMDTSCADTVLVTTPDCEPAAEPCALNADIVLTEGCDEQGQVTYTLTANATNGSAGGFNLYIDGSLAADSPYPYNNAAGYPITLPGDGMNYHLEVVDADSLDCVQELEVTTPDCGAACSMTLDTVLTDARQVHIVQVRDFDFFPKDITVDVGDTVRFVWTGAVPHTATSDATQGPDSWNSGLLGQGAVYDLVLSTAGVHPYYCVPHGSPGGVGMAGTIEAVEACADGMLLAAVQFSVTSPGINGYEVYVDGTLTPDSPYDYDTTAIQTVFIELPADGIAHSVQIVDVEDADCQLQTTVVSPDCSDPCLGFSADFGFTVDPANLSVQFEEAASESTDTWVWNFGDGSASSNEPSPSHTYAEAGNYTVCLLATDLETACSDTICKTVEVGGFVCEADFTYEAEGLSVQFTSTAQSSSPVSNLSWTFGNGFSLQGDESPSYTYDTLGVYTVCLTLEAEGCVDEHCMEVDLSDPCLMFRPDFAFTASEEDALRLQFVDLTTGEPNQWLWGFGDGITSNQQDPTHTYDNSGTYNVCLLVQDTLKGCNEAFCMPIEVGVTGTAEARDINRAVTLYPNPAARHEAVWTIEGIEEQDYGQPLQLLIYDMRGKTVSRQQLQGQPQLQIEAPQAVAAGLYIVEIRSGEHLYQGRIMIQ